MTVSRVRRPLLLAAALVVTAGLTACAGPVATAPASAGPASGAAQDAAPASRLPGLHVTNDVALVSESETHVTFASLRTCDDLSGMLASGQWRRVDSMTFGALGAEEQAMIAGFGGVRGDLLQRGTELVFARLDGGATCSANIASVRQGDLTLEGPGLPGTSHGWVAATRCDLSTSTGDLTVSLYFDTDARVGGQGQLVLEKAADGYVVADDALDLLLLAHADRFMTTMSAAYAGGGEPPVMPLEPGEEFTGSATVAPGDVPAGRIDLRGLLDGNTGDGDITFGLSFSCPGVIATM